MQMTFPIWMSENGTEFPASFKVIIRSMNDEESTPE